MSVEMLYLSQEDVIRCGGMSMEQTIEDLEEGAWLDVDCDGEVRQVTSAKTVFREPGRYTITTHDRAGNTNTYRFILHFYLNISAVTAISLAAGGVLGLIFYSRWVRRHARVG